MSKIDNNTPERVRLLNEAADLVTGQRQEDYGTPEENFTRMAELANIQFRKNLEKNIPLTARQMADWMILYKMSRLINSPTEDTYKDIAGYAGLGWELASIEKAKEKSKVQVVVNHNIPPLATKISRSDLDFYIRGGAL